MLKIKRLAKSFFYSFRGLKKVFFEEQNFKIQLIAAGLVFVLGIYFGITTLEWIAIVLVSGMVLIAEIINSAIERITDALKPRLDNYVKEIKDIMSGAVMLASIIAIIIGILVFYPYFIHIVNF